MSSRDDEASDEKYSGNDDEPDGTTEPCAGTSKVCSVINTTRYGTTRRMYTSSFLFDVQVRNRYSAISATT